MTNTERVAVAVAAERKGERRTRKDLRSVPYLLHLLGRKVEDEVTHPRHTTPASRRPRLILAQGQGVPLGPQEGTQRRGGCHHPPRRAAPRKPTKVHPKVKQKSPCQLECRLARKPEAPALHPLVSRSAQGIIEVHHHCPHHHLREEEEEAYGPGVGVAHQTVPSTASGHLRIPRRGIACGHSLTSLSCFNRQHIFFKYVFENEKCTSQPNFYLPSPQNPCCF